MTLTYEDLVNTPNTNAWKAWKLSTSPRVLEDLMINKDDNVRLGVAWNPNTPTKSIVLLASDDDKRVRAAALQRIKEIEAGGKE